MSIRNPPLTKHPDDHSEYFAPFDAWLCDGAEIDAILSVESSVPDELMVSNIRAHDAYTVAYTLTGGVAPRDYDVEVKVETNRILDDETKEILTRLFPVRVRD